MSFEPPLRGRLPAAAFLTVVSLVLVLAPRWTIAQSCTVPDFTPPSGGRIVPTGVVQPGHIAVGDFNRDGRLDFVVTDLLNPTFEIFLQTPLPAPPGSWTSQGLVGTVGVPTSVKIGRASCRDGAEG